MPIYEYRCGSCGHQQEFLQKVSDAPLTVCTACGKPEFSKMVTAAGFQLKGSGWYVTDFKNKGSSGSGGAKSEGSSSGSKPEGSSSSGESKGESSGEGGKKAAPACGAGGCSAC